MYTVGSLFSGIGGIDLAFSLAGFDIRWQVEIDPFCQKILQKHAPEYWPNAKVFSDVKEVGSHNLEPVTALVGGFPCTDISNAGKRAGIKEGTRSGLWIEFARIIGEIRPRVVFLENVAAITGRDGERVIADLTALGYDAQWRIIPASAVGAPHERKRWWCVAIRSRNAVADTYLTRSSSIGGVGQTREIGAGDAGPSGELAYPERPQRREINSAASSLVGDGSISGRQEDAGDTGPGSEELYSTDGRTETETQRATRSSLSSELAHAQSTGATAAQQSGQRDSTLESGTELAHTESGIISHQQIIPDRQALVSPITGTGGRTSIGDTSTGIQVAPGDELDSTQHVVNPEGTGLQGIGQTRLATSEAQAGTGLDAGPERSGSELGNAQSIGREGNRSAGQQFTEARSGSGLFAGTDSRGGPDGIGGNALSGLVRMFDGLSNRLDEIRRQSRWPARPGELQWDWEPPRTIRKQRHRPARLKALGNAVVWQVAAPIAASIFAYLEETDRQTGTPEGDPAQTSASNVGGKHHDEH